MIVPYVVERTSAGGERTLDVYSRLLADRIVCLGSPIDDEVANVVVAQLLHLESAEPGNPIDRGQRASSSSRRRSSSAGA